MGQERGEKPTYVWAWDNICKPKCVGGLRYKKNVTHE